MSPDAEIEALPPAALQEAVAALWAVPPPGPRNLGSLPEFVRLRDTCLSLHSNACLEPFALRNALDALGLPCRPPPADSDLALNAGAAASHLHGALKRRTGHHLYLCPLDQTGDLPEFTFGRNRIAKFTAAGFANLINVPRLRRVNPTWTVSADLFSEFMWLVIDAPAEPDPYFELISKPMNSDFAAIEPHRLRVPNAVEGALFAILLAPWEDWVDNDPGFWRPFEVPWVYSVDEHLFARRRPPPSADTLSGWHELDEPFGVTFVMPVRARLRQAAPSASDGIAAEISPWLTDQRWDDLVRAKNSPLFETPVQHFFTKAFLEQDPLDEFLAHVTTIEAALGLESDYPKKGQAKQGASRRKGATKLLASRVSALLGASGGKDYEELFNIRSKYLHGREMGAIPGKSRLLARQLARKVVNALVEAAFDPACPQSREDYLRGLEHDPVKLKHNRR
jgi:hypothetical protein